MQIIFFLIKKGSKIGIPFLFVFFSLTAFSQPQEKSKWALGLGTGWLHDYPGAAQGRIRFLPFPVYRGSFFRIDRISGISGEVYNDSRVDFSWNFIFQFPTLSKDIPARIGMPDLDWLLSIGPQFNYTIFQYKNQKFFFRFPIRYDFCTNFSDRTRFCGIAFNPGFRHSTALKNSGELTFRAEVFAHSSEFQQYFYEVPTAFATPTRPSYHARSGMLGFVYGFFHSIPFDGWEFSSSFNVYDYTLAVNKDSPLLILKTNYALFFAFTIDL